MNLDVDECEVHHCVDALMTQNDQRTGVLHLAAAVVVLVDVVFDFDLRNGDFATVIPGPDLETSVLDLVDVDHRRRHDRVVVEVRDNVSLDQVHHRKTDDRQSPEFSFW